MSEQKSDIAWTPTPTGTFDHKGVQLKRKSIMETLEAVKTILEIIVIFITFPQYAPQLAAITVLGAIMYYLLEHEDSDSEEKESDTSTSEETDECQASEEPDSNKTTTDPKA